MESYEIELTYRKPAKVKNFKVGDRVHTTRLEVNGNYWAGTVVDNIGSFFLIKEDAGGNSWETLSSIDFLP